MIISNINDCFPVQFPKNVVFSFSFQFCEIWILRPSSCIWDQDQALKNVILGSSSDPRIRIKFCDQDQGEKLGSKLILILI